MTTTIPERTEPGEVAEQRTERKSKAMTTPPRGADLEHWAQSGGFGTDGAATWKRVQRRNDETGETEWAWELLVKSATRFTADRQAAPDPDFPDRTTDAEEAPEASSDVEVSWRDRTGELVTCTYRDMLTSELIKGRHLKLSGRRALLGLGTVSDSAMGTVFRAANELSELYDPAREVFFTVTGWHTDPAGRPFFVTGNGAIGPDGFLSDTAVRIDERLRCYAPAAAPTGAEFRDAFEACMSLVDKEAADPRILVTLAMVRLAALDGVFRDPSDPDAEAGVSPSAWLDGSSGVGKSSVQAASANVLAPGIRYNSLPFKAGNSINGGVTIPTLEDITFRGRDLALDFDDLDPGEPEDKRAAWQNALIRRVADQKARGLSKRSGGARASKPARSTAIGSGEPLDAEQSAENRTLNISVSTGDVRRATMREMTGADDRIIRSGLGGGVIRELATDRGGYRATRRAAARALRPMFAAGDVPGPVDRGADVMAELAATAWVTLHMQVKHGMSLPDARRRWAQIKGALLEAWRVHLGVIGAGSRASRAVELISEGIISGSVVIASAKEPTQPPADTRYAAGWRKSGMDAPKADGKICGYVDDMGPAPSGDLWLLPTVTTGAVQRMVREGNGTFSGGVKTLAQSLMADGVGGKPSDLDKNRTDRQTLGNGARARVWTVSAAAVAGEVSPSRIDASRDYSAPLDPARLPAPNLETGAPADTPAAPEPERAPTDSAELFAAIEEAETLEDMETLRLSFPGHAVADSPDYERLVTAWRAKNAALAAAQSAKVPAPRHAEPEPEPAAAPADAEQQTIPEPEPAAATTPSRSRSRRPARAKADTAKATGSARVHYRAAAAVIDTDGTIHYSDGTSEPHGPFTSLAEVVAWLDSANLGTHQEYARDSIGQAWLMPGAATLAGLPEREPARDGDDATRHPAVDLLRSAGWNLDKARASMTVSRETEHGRRYSRVCVPGWFDAGNDPIVTGVADGTTTAASLARRLGLHVDVIGTPFTVSGGYTMQDVLRATRPGGTGKRVDRDNSTRGAYAKREAPAATSCMVNGIDWRREPSAEERARAFVVVIDKNGQFLGTMSNVEVGIGSARIIDRPTPFDKTKPGYWLLDVPAMEWALPPIHYAAGRGEPIWLPTPKVAEMVELGLDPQPQAAQIYDERSRYFDKAQPIYRDARALCHAHGDDPDYRALLGQVKAGYSSVAGSFASEYYRDSEFYYPHWRHHIIGQSEANLSRNLRKIFEVTGAAPIAVYRDAMVYLTDDPDPAALVKGTGLAIHPWKLGNFKHVHTGPAASVLSVIDRPGPKASASRLIKAIKEGKA